MARENGPLPCQEAPIAIRISWGMAIRNAYIGMGEILVYKKGVQHRFGGASAEFSTVDRTK